MEIVRNASQWWSVSHLITESVTALISLALAPCSICGRFIGCRKWIYTPRCGGHISILPLFPLPLAKFLYQTRFGRGRMGAGACEIPAAVPSPAPGSSSTPVPALAYFCTDGHIAAPWVARVVPSPHHAFPRTWCRPTTELLNYEIMFSRESTVTWAITSTSASTKKMTTFKIQRSE